MNPSDTFFQERLEHLRENDLYRKIRSLEMLEGNLRRLDGKEVLLFCGNDYLGLSRHPRVVRAFQVAAGEYGVGSGAARLVAGGISVHEALEKKIAAVKRKEKALLFSAGYLANLGAIAGLATHDDVVIMDKLCHASLIDAARLSGAQVRIFPHKNYERCEEILKLSGAFKKRVLVTDSVFSMDGDLADLKELTRLKQTYDALLIVDDAHATGVLGKEGQGACENWEDKIDVITGTLSKAIGGLGGFMAASEILVDYAVNHARPFIFATSLPPALCAAALEALYIIESEPELRDRLWKNVGRMQQCLDKSGFEMTSGFPIFPVILGEEKIALETSKTLMEGGILVPAIRYPTVAKGKARLRVTVNSLHREEDFSKFGRLLASIKKRVFLDPV
ncbi:MAG TPA: 8-amino-7-oxononanoate synthase [Verrucomicrobiae bacterium]|nr:8-amino-7-oxononanoate synthase [Verrucomicrobiae bacterium]